MQTSLLGSVLENLQKCKYRWPNVARESGVQYGTIKRIARGETKSPGVVTVEKLAVYFAKNNGG
jgi:hypothetical protein